MRRAVVAAMLSLSGCGVYEAGSVAQPRRADAAAPSVGSSNASDGAASAPRPTEATTDCEPDAPQSPCPIVGRWRIVRTFGPALPDPTADEMRMAGATFTVTVNADGPGAIRWDGPDTGRFDIRDVCAGPFLSAKNEARPDESRATLGRALKAWDVAGVGPGAARHLGCDQGNWATPSDAGGEWFGLFLPMGERLAFEWYEDRFILAERIG